MKKIKNLASFLVLVTALAPLLAAADLSTYRGFKLGATLNATVKHSGADLSEVTLLYTRPELIQELQWRPNRFFSPSRDEDPVDQVHFAFGNGRLFRVIVKYDSEKVAGLTAEDLVGGISAQYGMPNRPGVTMVLHSPPSDETVQVVARWEEAA